MADSLLISFIVFLAAGLALSALITYRDFRSLQKMDGNYFYWQVTLVVLDVAQIFLLLCSIGSIVFMVITKHRLSWAELGIVWALQSMFCTNVRSPKELRKLTNKSDLPPSPTLILTLLAEALGIHIHGGINCEQWRGIFYFVGRAPDSYILAYQY
jgi:hypothetical protein